MARHTATATATAHDPTVSLRDLQQAVLDVQAAETAAAPQRRIDNAKDKVARAKQALADAQDELKAAVAAKGN